MRGVGANLRVVAADHRDSAAQNAGLHNVDQRLRRAGDVNMAVGNAVKLFLDGLNRVANAGLGLEDVYKRQVTTSVAVTGSKTGAHTVSCKTASDIPKEKIFAVIDALRGLTVPAPVRIGDVLLPDAAGTGVPIIATKHVD